MYLFCNIARLSKIQFDELVTFHSIWSFLSLLSSKRPSVQILHRFKRLSSASFNWKSFKKQKITFKPEKDSIYDRFAVPGQTIPPGTSIRATVGHITIELRRYIWFPLKRGANVMEGAGTGGEIYVTYKLSHWFKAA